MDRWIGVRAALVMVGLLAGCTPPAENVVESGTTGTPATGTAAVDGGSGDLDMTSSDSESSSGDVAACEEWEVPIGVLDPRAEGAPDGSLWIVDTDESSGAIDWLVEHYGPDGEALAANHWGGPGADAVHTLATGPDSELYAAGLVGASPDGKGPTGETVVNRFDGEGNEVWSSVVTLDGEVHSTVRDITVTADGSIYVIGRALLQESEAGPVTAYSFVAKYSPGGEELWFDLLFGLDDMTDSSGDHITPDGMGGVYAVGASPVTLTGEPGSGLSDLWVAHYTTDGARDWFSLFGGELRESPVDAAADADGNLYISVNTSPLGGRPDIPLLLAVGPDGEQRWTIQGEEEQSLPSLAADSAGDLHAILAGGSNASSMALATYDADGTVLATRDLEGQVLGWPQLVLSGDDELYLSDLRPDGSPVLIHLCSDT